MPKPSLAQLIDVRDSYIRLLTEWPNSLWFPGEIQYLNEQIHSLKAKERQNG